MNVLRDRRNGLQRIPRGISTAQFSTLGPGFTGQRYNQAQSALAPFPLRYDVQLTYGVNVALSTVGSLPTGSSYAFRMNSAYDPDFTGIGEQPYQWDQVSAMYSQYIVKGVYIDLSFNDPTSSGLWVGYSIHTATTTNDTPAGKTLGDVMSRPVFRFAPLTDYGNQVVTMREHVPMHQVFGLTKGQYMNVVDQFGAATSTNPLSVAFLDLGLIDPNSKVSPQYVRVVGRLVMDIQLFDYKAPSGS